jgi:hypothetical protein
LSVVSIGGCASTNQRLAVLAIECSASIPEEIRKEVQGVAKLPPNATVGDLAVALDSQTGNLDKANGKLKDALAIVEFCDKRNKEVIKLLSK